MQLVDDRTRSLRRGVALALCSALAWAAAAGCGMGVVGVGEPADAGAAAARDAGPFPAPDAGSLANPDTGPLEAVDDAELVGIQSPGGVAGTTASVAITVRNTGTSTWTNPAVGLSALESNTLTWIPGAGGGTSTGLASQVLYLPATPVAPSAEATFEFQVALPAAAGTYTLAARMARAGAAAFGPEIVGRVAAAEPPVLAHGAEIVFVDVPLTGASGALLDVAITLRNTGASTWIEAADHTSGFRLLSLPDNAITWVPGASGGYSNGPGDQRIFLPADVPPGGQVAFSFQLRLPEAAGQHAFAAQMSAPGDAPFGPLIPASVLIGASTPCTVRAAGDDALDPALIAWLDANLGDSNVFPHNARLDSVTIAADRRTISWTGERLAGGDWYEEYAFRACVRPDDPFCVDGNMSVVGCVNGQWYGGRFEFTLAGIASYSAVLEWNPGQPPFVQTKLPPLNSWYPTSGEPLYFVQHSLNVDGWIRPEPRGRSQIYGPVGWP